MRTKTIDLVVKSDVDLTALASRRVNIVREGIDEYRITSFLKVYGCERHSFVGRYLRRKKTGLKYISGNCSAPTGYFWNDAGPLRDLKSSAEITQS